MFLEGIFLNFRINELRLRLLLMSVLNLRLGLQFVVDAAGSGWVCRISVEDEKKLSRLFLRRGLWHQQQTTSQHSVFQPVFRQFGTILNV